MKIKFTLFFTANLPTHEFCFYNAYLNTRVLKLVEKYSMDSTVCACANKILIIIVYLHQFNWKVVISFVQAASCYDCLVETSHNNYWSGNQECSLCFWYCSRPGANLTGAWNPYRLFWSTFIRANKHTQDSQAMHNLTSLTEWSYLPWTMITLYVLGLKCMHNVVVALYKSIEIPNF